MVRMINVIGIGISHGGEGGWCRVRIRFRIHGLFLLFVKFWFFGCHSHEIG